MMSTQIDGKAAISNPPGMDPYAHIADIDIVATIVKLARAAPPRTRAKTILADARRAYPEVEDERIYAAMKDAADLLLAQHSS